MLSKNNTWILGVILVIVVALYLILEYSQDNEKNYRTQLPVLDTAAIKKIVVSPPDNAEKIVLFQKNGSWQVQNGDKQYQADAARIESLITSLNIADVKSVASTTTENWEKFNITNDLGTRIKFEKQDGSDDDIVVGKFDYIQPKNQNPDPYGRKPQGEMLSYVRVGDEPSVYAIDGMIALGLGKTISDYRDKTILNIEKESIDKIEFTYPGKTNFALIKENENWTFQDGVEADSAIVAKYLNSISRFRGKEFSENVSLDDNEDGHLSISYDGLKMADVKFYAPDTSATFIYSSQNPTNIFNDSDKKLKEKLFVSEDFFLGNK